MTAPDTAPKAEITFDEFAKIDLRIGRIATAEKVPKKTRLLKLTVDVGEETPRTIIAGIGESYDPQVLVGKHAVFVLNLAPRTVGGVESHGMILALGPAPDSLSLLTTNLPYDGTIVTAGSRIG